MRNGKSIRDRKGSTAVFLTAVLLSFFTMAAVLSESAAGWSARSAGHAVMDLAGRSLLSEYHGELQRRYGLFQLPFDEGAAAEKLRQYCDASFAKKGTDLWGLQLGPVALDPEEKTLLNREILKEQILQYMDGRFLLETEKQWHWLSAAGDLLGLEELGRDGSRAGEELEKAAEKLERLENRSREGMTEEEEATLDEKIAAAEREYEQCLEKGLSLKEKLEKKADQWKGLLREAETGEGLTETMDAIRGQTEENGELSDGAKRESSAVLRRQWAIQILPSRLMGIKTGWHSGLVEESNLSEQLLIELYLASLCGDRVDPFGKKESFFENELEYLLYGEMADKSNGEKAENALLALRTALDLISLYSCPEKIGAVSAAAAAILPGPAQPVGEMLLALAWSAAEASLDVKTLLEDGKVPLIKGEGQWRLSLESVLEGEGSAADRANTAGRGTEDRGHGLCYKDHLLLLLFAADEECCLYRFLDVAQLNIQGGADDSFSFAGGCTGFSMKGELVRSRSFLPSIRLRTSDYEAVFSY